MPAKLDAWNSVDSPFVLAGGEALSVLATAAPAIGWASSSSSSSSNMPIMLAVAPLDHSMAFGLLLIGVSTPFLGDRVGLLVDDDNCFFFLFFFFLGTLSLSLSSSHGLFVSFDIASIWLVETSAFGVDVVAANFCRKEALDACFLLDGGCCDDTWWLLG